MSETAKDIRDDQRSPTTERDRTPIEVSVRAPIFLRQPSRYLSPRFAHQAESSQEPPGIFDAEDLAILMAAYEEACAFFGGRLGPAQRRDVALAIVSHARKGVIDTRRLAIKGIVAL